MISLNNIDFAVTNTSTPIKKGFFRVWYSDAYGTSTGWREIPLDREGEAKNFEKETLHKGKYFISSFDFELTQGL